MRTPPSVAVRPGSGVREDAVQQITQAAENGATEIHFKVPNVPTIRVAGKLLPMGQVPLTPQGTTDVLARLAELASAAIPAKLESMEFSFGLHRVGRFHVFAYRQWGSIALVVRRMELDIPTLEELGLPGDIVDVPRGLSLIVGLNGPRMLHAIVGAFNERRRGNVLVLESPLSFLHRDARASVSQREVGTEVASYAIGIRDAVRMGTDLLAIADVSDRETAEAVLGAAERDVPVLAGVSARVPANASWWLTRVFDGAQRADAEFRLASVLQQVISEPEIG